ncbi:MULTISPECIES: Ig-like domain-containing protein [unclassified Curtobacterium]|uniref:Ig-like domain-containing protein n=1 Tax=unclassified Curtobacterium TaxID=257496 RepID=UPI00135C3A81|nr:MULTISPECIES: Ig-like domain-containing protein [unclassified Curtobacterium]MBF4588392.1 hypothetical protein [Curtobacterium sp. VKM Ac-2887]
MRKTLKASLSVAALAVAGTALLASPANATDMPSTTTIAAGQHANVPFTMQNDGATIPGMVGAGSITFNAPANTTFGAQAGVTTQYSSDRGTTWVGNAAVIGNCTVGGAGKTLTCTQTTNSSWPAGGQFRFLPVVTVDAGAQAGTYSANSTYSFEVANGGGPRTETASLNVRVIVKPAAPTVSNIDNGSGNTVLSGDGVPGATVTIKDDQGNTVGTATVGASGKWTADLGSNLSGTASDLTITQTANGLDSDPTTVSAANLPIANPAVAGGLGLAAAAALGAVVLVRRKRATA